MRKLVIALALTTTAFAGSTVYFARQLSLERERVAAIPAVPAVTTIPGLARTAAPPAAPTPAASQPVEGLDAAMSLLSNIGISGQAMSEADIQKMQAEFSRNVLARLADPQRNEEMLAEYKMMMRHSYPRLDQVIGLSPDEYARFIELSARQQMDLQESNAKCMLDPACEEENLHAAQPDSREAEIDQLLGAERARKLETYRNTMGEREAVSQLRNRLSETQRLSDASAELLITALAEERELIHRDVSARSGGDVHSFSLGVGLVFAPGDGSTFEERYESARQSSQRLRDRAAPYLNAEQMRAFNEMQDETLIGLRGALRNNKIGVMSGEVTLATPINVTAN